MILFCWIWSLGLALPPLMGFGRFLPGKNNILIKIICGSFCMRLNCSPLHHSTISMLAFIKGGKCKTMSHLQNFLIVFPCWQDYFYISFIWMPFSNSIWKLLTFGTCRQFPPCIYLHCITMIDSDSWENLINLYQKQMEWVAHLHGGSRMMFPTTSSSSPVASSCPWSSSSSPPSSWWRTSETATPTSLQVRSKLQQSTDSTKSWKW